MPKNPLPPHPASLFFVPFVLQSLTQPDLQPVERSSILLFGCLMLLTSIENILDDFKAERVLL